MDFKDHNLIIDVLFNHEHKHVIWIKIRKPQFQETHMFYI